MDTMESEGYKISLCTYRNKNKAYGDYNWVQLDLESQTSVDNFISNLEPNYYSKIIMLPGNTLGNFKSFKDVPLDDLGFFYNAYSFNYIWVAQSCIEALAEDGHLVYMSSMAANTAIEDAHYSAVKASVQAFIKSISISLSGGRVAYSISPGLIYDTNAFDHSDYKGDISDLVTKEQIAQLILDADSTYNGKVIEIGY